MRRVGIDENGLGAQLGPLIVTAVEADVSKQGSRALSRKLPRTIREDLDDSKALVSCHDTSLGEAWARVAMERIKGSTPRTPRDLAKCLLREKEHSLRRLCPRESEPQCWSTVGENFVAETDQLDRLRTHLDALQERGIRLRSIKSEMICSARLSQLRREGVHRFAADLGGMESLLLSLEEPNDPLLAVCGKVGGIGKYGDFFAKLDGRTHRVLEEGRAQSRYHFPGLGEIRFVRDADATDPLVMLASLVGKYLRELFMRRIGRYYIDWDREPPSGYHDPVTERFMATTESARTRLKIAQDCFVRSREEVKKKPKTSGAPSL